MEYRPKIRANPEDGHAVLLMETSEGNRTFTDYPNLTTGLDGLIGFYEEYRVSEELPRDGYDLSQVNQFIDSFFKIELLLFSKDISRYKRITKEPLKKLFLEQIVEALDDQTNGEEEEFP